MPHGQRPALRRSIALGALLAFGIGFGIAPRAVVAGDLIFADGFETGTTERWSRTVRGTATVVDCSTVTDLQMTNEIAFLADWSYVPNGNGTLQVGGAALWAHAAGPPWQHDITSGVAPVHDGRFKSALITEHGATICVRFVAPGVYPYFCSQHPDSDEQGTVTVP